MFIIWHSDFKELLNEVHNILNIFIHNKSFNQISFLILNKFKWIN